MPCAIITGAAGQDGSYLCELLLEKGYQVYGMIRRSSSMLVLDRLKNARGNPNLHLVYGDVTDMASCFQLFRHALANPASSEGPLEVYNLAAQSHVKVSFETPMYTGHSDAIGVLNVLEVIVQLGLTSPDKARFYQASTSELYGSSEPPQNEETAFHPRSPYAIAKLYGYWIVRNYREAKDMYAVNGILFNHESERRGETFVSRKITRAVADWHHGDTRPLALGNMYALRDWGHAQDYVEGMWRILQHPVPQDWVIATGRSYTVKDFVEKSFACINRTIRWEGTGVDEKGYDQATGELLVKIDPKFFRPTEVDHLRGDPTKALRELNWKPPTELPQLVKRMVEHDIATHPKAAGATPGVTVPVPVAAAGKVTKAVIHAVADSAVA